MVAYNIADILAKRQSRAADDNARREAYLKEVAEQQAILKKVEQARERIIAASKAGEAATTEDLDLAFSEDQQMAVLAAQRLRVRQAKKQLMADAAAGKVTDPAIVALALSEV